MTGAATSNRWIEGFLRPLILAGMVVCLAYPVVGILEELTRGQDGAYLWQGSYFLAFLFVASLEAVLSERVLRKRRITGWAYLGSRAAEALLLLLALKLVNYIPLGLDQLWAEASTWLADPYEFIQVRDFVSWILFLPLWAGSLLVAKIAHDLDLDEGETGPPADKTSPAYYLWLTQPPVARDRQEALEELVNIILWGGLAILIVSTWLYTFGPDVHNPALAALVYFALAVTLLTQARFSISHAGWRAQGISIQPGIGLRWLLWSVIFLVGLALAALILPTRFSMGPLTALLGLVGILYSALMFLVNLLVFLLFLPIAWLFPNVEQREFPTEQIPEIPGGPSTAGATPPWLEILASAIFWIVVLVIVGYAVRRFWKDRFGAWMETEEFQASWWGRLLAWLRSLWQGLWTWGGEVQSRVAQRLARSAALEEGVTRPRRFFFPGRLPPRELVRYFYLSMARRAAEAGRPRQPAETPHEYQLELDQNFPELEPDLTGLTDAFIQARYSPQPVEERDVAATKPLWQRIKAMLRRRRLIP
jgi:hypothetical protein